MLEFIVTFNIVLDSYEQAKVWLDRTEALLTKVGLIEEGDYGQVFHNEELGGYVLVNEAGELADHTVFQDIQKADDRAIELLSVGAPDCQPYTLMPTLVLV